MGNCSAASIGWEDSSDDSIDIETKLDGEQQSFTFNVNDLNNESMEGWLRKKSKHLGSWRKRWTVLSKDIDRDQFILQTFKEKEIKTHSKPTESILINHDIEIETNISNTNEFTIYHKSTKNSFLFKACSDQQCNEWLNILNKYLNHINQYENNNKYNIDIIDDEITKIEIKNIKTNKVYSADIMDKYERIQIQCIQHQQQSDKLKLTLDEDKHIVIMLYYDETKSVRTAHSIILNEKQSLQNDEHDDEDEDDDEKQKQKEIEMEHNKESYKEYEFKFECNAKTGTLDIEIKHLKSNQVYTINMNDEEIKNTMKLHKYTVSDLLNTIESSKESNVLKINWIQCNKLAQILNLSENTIELILEINNEINTIQLKQKKDEENKSDEKSENKEEEAYKSAILSIETKGYGQYCSIEGLADRSIFKQHKNDKADPTAANMKKIMKEIRKELPKNICLSYNNGSMFVRFDESNPRFIQTMLIGLKDTPYFNGCFLFDIYLSNDYPIKPPKIQHTTNGASLPTANNGPGGFSPNLHKTTGKVCLSLLGTWSGPGWQPNKSNIYQILSTLLFMVFGAKHPYYMEPNHGGWEGTVNDKTKHDPKVIEYDEELLYHTAKSTILDILKKPYVGFEDVIKTHFKMKRKQIVEYMQDIMNNKDYSNNFKNKIKPINEKIKTELNKL